MTFVLHYFDSALHRRSRKGLLRHDVSYRICVRDPFDFVRLPESCSVGVKTNTFDLFQEMFLFHRRFGHGQVCRYRKPGKIHWNSSKNLNRIIFSLKSRRDVSSVVQASPWYISWGDLHCHPKLRQGTFFGLEESPFWDYFRPPPWYSGSFTCAQSWLFASGLIYRVQFMSIW